MSTGLLKQRSPRKCEERELESSWGPGCKRPRRASQGFGAALFFFFFDIYFILFYFFLLCCILFFYLFFIVVDFVIH